MDRKVLFITTGSHKDRNNWSGTIFNFYNVLSKENNLEVIDDINICKIEEVVFKVITKIFKKKYLLTREEYYSRKLGKYINKRIKDKRYDYIVCTSSVFIPYIETKIPIILYTDANFASMVGYYDNFNNFSNRTIIQANKIEKSALMKADIIIYASKWAKNTAISNYNIDESKIKVIPFGANMSSSTKQHNLEEIIIKREHNKIIKFLFIGVNFKRKGGDTAIKIVEYLNSVGYKSEIHIVGSEIDKKYKDKKYVKSYGFLNKDLKEDKEKLQTLYKESKFFILPTKAEAFGIVFCEASSYGLPSITYNTGGTSTAVNDKVNGLLFEIGESIDSIANRILEYNEKEAYRKLCYTSYERYKNELNWDSMYESLINII